MDISEKSWVRYVDALAKVNKAAADKMREFFAKTYDGSEESIQAIFDYGYALATKYGEGAAELACEMYDALAEASAANAAEAVPAMTATYGDVAKGIRGALKTSQNEEVIAGVIGRLVKRAGQDTTLQNAIRDGAEFAWIPHGDTCAFCIALAGNGWRKASPDILKNGHAEHIHANCDCSYAVRFNEDTKVRGYDPSRYREMYESAEGRTSTQKINAMRRRFYAQNKEEINAQKRDAYEKRKELNDSRAEETDV